MFDEIIDVSVDTDKKTITAGKAAAEKEAGFAKRTFKVDLETLCLGGGKAEQVMRLMDMEEIENLLAHEVENQKLLNSYGLLVGSTVRDLMDEIPLYASITLVIECDDFIAGQFRLTLSKRGAAGRELEEFYVRSFSSL